MIVNTQEALQQFGELRPVLGTHPVPHLIFEIAHDRTAIGECLAPARRQAECYRAAVILRNVALYQIVTRQTVDVTSKGGGVEAEAFGAKALPNARVTLNHAQNVDKRGLGPVIQASFVAKTVHETCCYLHVKAERAMVGHVLQLCCCVEIRVHGEGR